MEVIVAMLMLLLVGVAATRSMAVINQQASTNRLRLNARAIVDRCITRALNSPFSATTEPNILGLTTETRYNDTTNQDVSSTANPDIDMVVQDAGGSAAVSAKLFRTVTAVANDENVDIRRITLRIEYVSRGKTYNYSSTTVRAKG